MKKNIIDKVASLFPAWELSRNKAKLENKLLTNSFDAASRASSVFENYITQVSDPNTSMEFDLEKIVERSRDFARNNGIASAISNRTCIHAIGDKGLVCQPKIDGDTLGLSKDELIAKQKQFKKEYERFAHNPLNDFYRDQNPQEMGYSVLRSEIEGGDAFTLLPTVKRHGSDFDTKIQLTEGEFVSNPNFAQNTDKISFGVERDKNGVPTHYYFSNKHPGDMRNALASDWQRRKIYDGLGRKNVLHHWTKLRPGQLRGLPLITTVMQKIIQLETLSKAELSAAVLNSYYVLLLKGPRDKTKIINRNTDNNTSKVQSKFKLGSGSILEVDEDVTAQSWDPSRPNQLYKPFHDAISSEIGAAIGFAKSLLMLMFDKSYSASKGEILLSWMFFMSHRTKTAVGYYQPIYERVIDEAVAKGRLIAPGYFQDFRIRQAWLGNAYAQWFGPQMPSFDELKEARAEDIRINKTKTMSRQEIVAKLTGGDWMSDLFPEIEDETKAMKALMNILGVENEDT